MTEARKKPSDGVLFDVLALPGRPAFSPVRALMTAMSSAPSKIAGQMVANAHA